MSNKTTKDLLKIIGFFIYLICLLVSLYVAIYKTPQSFNIIPLIAIIGSAICSMDELDEIRSLIKFYEDKWINKDSDGDTKNL